MYKVKTIKMAKKQTIGHPYKKIGTIKKAEKIRFKKYGIAKAPTVTVTVPFMLLTIYLTVIVSL